MKNIAFLWAILAVSVGLAQDKPSMAGNIQLPITNGRGFILCQTDRNRKDSPQKSYILHAPSSSAAS
jgi:hypothetical protein